MNRLWVRLTFAFVVVTLIGVTAVALLANVTATDPFREYLSRQEMLNQAGLVDDLAAFYRQNGNWNGVAVVMDGARPGMMGQGRWAMRGAPALTPTLAAPTLTLVDANGTLIFGDRSDAALTATEQRNAIPINVDGATVGYLVVNSPRQGMLNQAQQAFLDQLRSNLILAALIASGPAILLGLLISRALATPLAELAQGARAFAKRDWTHRVQPRGSQEVTEVAQAFNDMAASLQHAEAMRRDMVADIAHELRTPVAVIQGNLRAMLDGVYPLERAEIATIYDETRLLNRLIDDLRELALAEAGQLNLNLRAVEAGAILRATADHLAALADAQGVSLRVQIPDGLPHAQADADRMAQVLRNLLTNALRYTPAGGQVTLAIRRADEGPGDALAISVEDSGAGIAPEDLPRVFDRFYRGDKSRSRASGGTGLGLAIAKTLIETMGGQIGVESAHGHGSRFWFTVPVAPSHPANG